MKDNVRSGVIVNLIRTVTITLLSFITFPFATKFLGDTAFGTFSWCNSFVYYFLIIAKLGIPQIAIRECAKVRDDQKAFNKKAQEFFLLQAFFTLASFALMVVIIFTAKGELVKNQDIIFILSINFIAGVFSFEWIYIALEKHFYISFRSIATLTISAAFVILFVKYPRHIYLYSLLAISSTIMTAIINCIYLRKFVSLKKQGPYDFKQYIKPLMVIFLITIVVAIYNQTDSFILGYLDLSKAQVGSYSVGIKGIEIIITIITSLSAVFIPRATKYYQMEDKRFFRNLTNYSMNICLFIALPAIVTMILLSNQVISVVSNGAAGTVVDNGGSLHIQYEYAQSALVILASIMFTYSVGDIIYSQVLLPMDKEKIYLITMAIGAVLNIAGSVILGKFVFVDRPIIGVALATSVSDFLILAFLVTQTRQFVGKALFNWNNLKIVLAAGLVAISTYLLDKVFSQQASNALMQIAIILLVDAIIYVGSLLLMREKLVYSFVRKRAENE